MVVSNLKIAGQTGVFGDRRIRLSAKPLAREQVYGPHLDSNILHPLHHSGGLLFPFTPSIQETQTVNYESYDPVHSNQQFLAYNRTPAKEYTISGPFTSMNQDEARYSLAVIHFLRSVTKMYFGVKSDITANEKIIDAVKLRGTPPPILLLNGYGTAIFHNVPVVITNYTVEFPQDVDYVEVDNRTIGNEAKQFTIKQVDEITGEEVIVSGVNTVNGNVSAWVPTQFNITVQITVQNTPDRLRREFNLNDFRSGKLIKRGGWV